MKFWQPINQTMDPSGKTKNRYNLELRGTKLVIKLKVEFLPISSAMETRQDQAGLHHQPKICLPYSQP